MGTQSVSFQRIVVRKCTTKNMDLLKKCCVNDSAFATICTSGSRLLCRAPETARRNGLFCLKNKFFLIILGVIAFISLILYFTNYNSRQSRCQRKYGIAKRVFPSKNRLQELQLESVIEKSVQACIKNGD